MRRDVGSTPNTLDKYTVLYCGRERRYCFCLSLPHMRLYFVFTCNNVSSFIFFQLLFAFTKYVPSYNVEVVSSLSLDAGIILLLFIFNQAKQIPHPPTHKQILVIYCAFVLSGNGRNITKYSNVDICSTGHVLSVQ